MEKFYLSYHQGIQVSYDMILEAFLSSRFQSIFMVNRKTLNRYIRSAGMATMETQSDTIKRHKQAMIFKMFFFLCLVDL